MNHTLHPLFADLTTLLQQYQDYWRPMAFHDQQLPWMLRHPDLTSRLLALPLPKIEALATDAGALTNFMAGAIPDALLLQRLCTLPVLESKAVPPVPARFHAGIPGRKWQQVEAFARCLPECDLPVLEWCAGKSHLGFFQHHCGGQTVTALEWDAALVHQANARAQRDHLPLHSITVDVLAPEVSRFIQSQQQVLALHACGELHERLLQLCVQQRAAQIHLAPCCYHKRQQHQYVPLSQRARQANLALNTQEIHTAVMETATAGATLQRQRRQLQIMRLGFDCLQRDVRGDDSFLPLPSLPARWVHADFAAFCQHCAVLKGLDLPAVVDWQRYLQRGEQRFLQVSALDLVRFLFRRPLEIWLLLDRALYLQEQGYQVRLGTFCSRALTPRNILLQAHVG